jgi:threonyl-tRNA synthetase
MLQFTRAHAKKIPYMLIVGDKEEKAGTVSIRDWNDKQKTGIKPLEFLTHLKEEIEKKQIAPSFCT